MFFTNISRLVCISVLKFSIAPSFASDFVEIVDWREDAVVVGLIIYQPKSEVECRWSGEGGWCCWFDKGDTRCRQQIADAAAFKKLSHKCSGSGIELCSVRHVPTRPFKVREPVERLLPGIRFSSLCYALSWDSCYWICSSYRKFV